MPRCRRPPPVPAPLTYSRPAPFTLVTPTGQMYSADEASVYLQKNYQIGATVGVGGFCKVKLATHVPTGEQIAVKVFDKLALLEEDGQESLDKLLEENNVLGKLHNEHIVRLYEVCRAAALACPSIPVLVPDHPFAYRCNHLALATR
jgi:serine/threonine protein kinase